MAHGAVSIRFGARPGWALLWPGLLASALILALVPGTLAVVAARAEGGRGLNAADWAAIRFTVTQAFLSAALSLGIAIPVARGLARRQFPGRSVLVTLLGAPFILPVIVAILGLLAVFGRDGIVSHILALFGADPIHIYGFHGVILAHVFFNLPLAVRMLLQGWASIPAERFRLAAQVNAPIWSILERPMVMRIGPGIFLVIFLICLGSFAVALALGGGPRATTIELAIYQAVRLDFDLSRGALLGLIQVGLCILVALVLSRLPVPDGMAGGLDRVVQRWDGSRFWDGVWIAFAALLLILPLSMVVLNGLTGLAQMPGSIWSALGQSVGVACVSTALCIALAVALAISPWRWVQFMGVLPLAASSLVVGTGLFIMIRAFDNPLNWGLPVTALVNAMLSLPFALRVIHPAVQDAEAGFGRLADGLGLTGWQRLRWLILPRLRASVGFAAGLAAALSMGDLGVIALFGGAGAETLPLLMHRLMGAYQMQAAAGVGLVLLTTSLLLFWVLDRWGGAGRPG